MNHGNKAWDGKEIYKKTHSYFVLKGLVLLSISAPFLYKDEKNTVINVDLY